jgi:hypothetical protein
MKTTTRGLIFVLLFVFASASHLLALDFSGPNDDWAIEPKTPEHGLAGPRNDKEIHGWVRSVQRREQEDLVVRSVSHRLEQWNNAASEC